MENSSRHLRVAIVGAGFAGLGTAIRLTQEGERDFAIFERTAGVGGVWYVNTYPGCACDVQSHLFSLSFAPNPGWTRLYSPQRELHAYAQDCVARFGLEPHLRLEHEVLDAAWDEVSQRWRISTSRGSFTADVLVAGTGSLSDPSIPSLPGLENFRGATFHSARWNHDFGLDGARVAVIGTGASAIQFVPAIQPRVTKLHLFQRTPPWIIPRFDLPVPGLVRKLFAALPFTQKLLRAAIYLLRESLVFAFMNPRLMRMMQILASGHLRLSIRDPALRAKLTPDYLVGCKRILISDDYYPSLTQPNVEIVSGGVREVRASSVIGEDGVEREVDAIIFGTGFLATEPPLASHVRGRDGVTLAEAWQGSPKAHAGTTVTGFPNLFLLQGPNTGLGHTSVLVMIESQIEHVMGALGFMKRTATRAIEPKPEVQAAYVAEVDRRMTKTVWSLGGCASWYVDSTGRNSALWPGFTWAFRKRVARFDPAEYAAVPARAEPRALPPPDHAEPALAASADPY